MDEHSGNKIKIKKGSIFTVRPIFFKHALSGGGPAFIVLGQQRTGSDGLHIMLLEVIVIPSLVFLTGVRL